MTEVKNAVTPSPEKQDNVTPSPIFNATSTKFSNNLKDYPVVGKIGQGVYGKVYECLYQNTPYALKLQKTKHDYLGSALVESDILHRIQHPHLIRSFHTFFHKSYIVNVLELGNAMSEKSVVELNIQEFLLYIRQILQGLQFLHSHNIIHCDIKPDNTVLVQGVTKIVDFSLCQYNLQHTKNFEIQSPKYRAPEVFNKSDLSTKVDIWSVGILCSLILTGNYFFGASDKGYPNNIFTWKESKQPIGDVILKTSRFTNSKFVALASNFLNQMLHFDPKRRASSEQLLKDPIFELISVTSIDYNLFSTYDSGQTDVVTKFSHRDFLSFIKVGERLKVMDTTIILAIDIAQRYNGILSQTLILNDILVYLYLATLLNEPSVWNVEYFMYKKTEQELIEMVKKICTVLSFRLYVENYATVCRNQDPNLLLDVIKRGNKADLEKLNERKFAELCSQSWFVETKF